MPTAEFKVSDYLKTPEDIAGYLTLVLEDDDPKLLLLALRDVAEARGGIAALAEETGLNRESLYKTLSGNRNPGIETINAILRAYDLRLSVTAI